MKETYMIVIYVPEKLLSLQNKENIMKQVDKVKQLYGEDIIILHYLFPTKEEEWKIECINPKLISEWEFPKVQEILETNQKIIDSYLRNAHSYRPKDLPNKIDEIKGNKVL